MKKFLLIGLSVVLAHASFSTEVWDAMTFTIYRGWNAVYLPLTPSVSADAFFADWPTDAVGFYDQAAFLRTKQFTKTADDGSLGAVENGMKMWVRDNPGVSTFSTLTANGIYFFNVTNDLGGAVSVTKTVAGVPEPARISWHVALSTNAPLNFVGLAVRPNAEAALTEEGYFQGLDTGWTWAKGALFDPWGFDPTPTLNAFDGSETPTKPNGGVVAMDAAKASDWSGAFFVSPYGGLDLGTNACQGVVSIRNDAGTNRTVRVSLRRGVDTADHASPALPTVLAKEEGLSDEWIANLAATPFERELAAGETLRLVLAVDRTTDGWPAAGTELGGVLDVTDISSERPTAFETHLVFSVTSDGGAYRTTQWPKGLWLAEVALDQVVQIIPKEQVTRYTTQIVTNTATYMVATSATERVDKESSVAMITNYVETVTVSTNQVPVYATEPVKAGSTMRVRVLLHVDELGSMNLLQRARLGSRRVSSLVLAPDDPVRAGSGTFGSEATFAWTIGAASRANPFRHARHPDHGVANLFDISTTLRLVWTAHDGSAWNPEESLSGTATWSFTGLRREGALETAGSFTMRRVSKAALADLLEEL